MSSHRVSQFAGAGVIEPEGEEALVDGAGGVLIHVDISPRACLESCGELPATGGGVPEVLVIIGAALIVAGIVFLAARVIRRRRARD